MQPPRKDVKRLTEASSSTRSELLQPHSTLNFGCTLASRPLLNWLATTGTRFRKLRNLQLPTVFRSRLDSIVLKSSRYMLNSSNENNSSTEWVN